MKKGDIIQLEMKIQIDAEVLAFSTGYVHRDCIKVKIGDNEVWLELPKGSIDVNVKGTDDGRTEDVRKDNSVE